jgi:hypothetical protein
MVINSLEKAEIPFYIGEIAFNEEQFYFNKKDNIFQFRTNDYMFYKENLINIIEKKISNEYTKICIMDCDIMFTDSLWYDKVSQSLEENDIIQPFETAIYLNCEFKKLHIVKSSLYFFKNKFSEIGHPGFIWCFKREVLKKINLPEFCIIGSGDAILTYCLTGKTYKLTNQYDYLKSMMDKYIININNNEFKLNYLNLEICHLFHGNLSNRQYASRHLLIKNLLKSYNLTEIEEVIEHNEFGLFKWKENFKEAFNNLMLNYFKERNDDGL